MKTHSQAPNTNQLDAFSRLAQAEGNIYQKQDGSVTSTTGWKGRLVKMLRPTKLFPDFVARYDAKKTQQSDAATKSLFTALIKEYGLDTTRTTVTDKRTELSDAWNPVYKKLGVGEETAHANKLTCADVRSVLAGAKQLAAGKTLSTTDAQTPSPPINQGQAPMISHAISNLSPEGIRLQHVADSVIAHVRSLTPLGAPNKLGDLRHLQEQGIDNRSLAMGLDEPSYLATSSVSQRGFGALSPAAKANILGDFVQKQGAATCGLQAKAAYNHLVNELGERNVSVVTVGGKADHVFLVIGAKEVPKQPQSYNSVDDMQFALGPDAMVVDPWAGESFRLDSPDAPNHLSAIFDQVVGHPDQKNEYGYIPPTEYTVTFSDHLLEGQASLPDGDLERTLGYQADGNTMCLVPGNIKEAMKQDVLKSNGAVFYERAHNTKVDRDNYPWLMSRTNTIATPNFRAHAHTTIGQLSQTPSGEALLSAVGEQVASKGSMVTIHTAGNEATRYDAEGKRLLLGSGGAEALAIALNSMAEDYSLTARVTQEDAATALTPRTAPTSQEVITRQQQEHALTNQPPTTQQLAQILGVEGNPPEKLEAIFRSLAAYHASVGSEAEIDRIADTYGAVQEYLAVHDDAPDVLFSAQDTLAARRNAIAQGLDGRPHDDLLPPKIQR